MHVAAASLVLFAACGYDPNRTNPGDGRPNDDGPTDTTVTTDTPLDTPIDTLPGPCNPSGNADVRLCFSFDSNTQDLSGHTNDASASGHTFVTGVNGLAISTTAATVVVDDDDSLDVTQLTVRMSVKPNALIPLGGTRQGLIENDAFRMHVMPGGGIRCALNDGTTEVNLANLALLTTKFTRVACTYNGMTLRVFYDGSELGSVTTVTTIVPVATITTIGRSEPLSDGEQFDGAIDDLAVFGSLEAP